MTIATLLSTSVVATAAVTGTWKNNADGLWSDINNWTGGIPTSAGDTANITANITGNRVITLDSDRTVGTLTIGDTVAQSNAYTLSGTGTLTFDTGTASAAALNQNSSSNGDTISASLALISALNIANNNATKTFTIGSAITNANATATARTIAVIGNGAGAVILSGNISDGATAGATLAITKSSANNSLTLSGTNNTFTGGVILAAGTLSLSSSTALGATASTLTITGGTLTGPASGSVTIANANAQNWNGNFTFAGAGNLNTGTGAVTMNASRTITASTTGTLTVGGAIGESTVGSSLTTVNGSTGVITGGVILSGANTYTGGTNVNGALVTFNNAGAIPATGSVAIGTGGAIAVSGAYTTLADWLGESRLAKNSTGALALTASSAENFDPAAAGFATLSLGAAVGTTVTYTGTLTPSSGTYYVGGGGGTLVLANTNALTGANAAVVGNGGGGLVALSAANDISGQVTIASGATLQIGNGSTTGSLNSASNVVANGFLGFNRTDTVTYNVPVSGTGGIAQNGTGVLLLSNTANTYATTAVNRGTVRLGAINALPTNSTLTLGNGSTAGTFDTSTFSQTVAAVKMLSTSSSVTNSITIGAGQTLTVNGTGGFSLGLPGQVGITTKATISGTTGTLNVDNTAANFDVGFANLDQGLSGNSATLDMSGLGSFIANVNEFRVSYGSIITSTLTLSNKSNAITANTMQISNSINNNAGAGTIILGTGTNVLDLATLNIGLSKGNGTLRFSSQTTGSPGTLTLTGKAGGKVNIVMANSIGSGTAGNLAAVLDLRGHNSTVTAGSLTVAARDTGTGNCTGTLSFDTGDFTVDNLTMAIKTATSTANNIASGTINLSGGSFTVNPGGSFILAQQSGALPGGNVTGSANGTLNITGGTFTSNANIVDGGGTTTSVLNLNGANATLDLTGHNIGDATNMVDTVTFGAGTLQNVGAINGTAGVTKSLGTGTNTLTLAGTNTYTGATTVNSGTVLVNGSINGSTVTTATGTTLGGYGHINLDAGQSVTIGSNATLAPGANSYGTLDVTGGDGVTLNSGILAIDVTDSNQDKLTIDGGATSDFDITGSSTLKLNAGQPGTFTIASWTGTRTGFFNLITINGGASEGYTVSTVGNITTYTFTSGHGSLVYDDDAKDIVVTLAIPEPASVFSLAGGCAALLGLTRQRRRRRL